MSNEDIEKEERKGLCCSFDIDVNLEFDYRPYSRSVSEDSICLFGIKKNIL